MTNKIGKALTELRDALEKLLGNNLIEVRLFGSRARGDAEPDSDVDIWVLVKESAIDKDEEIVNTATDVSLKYDLLIIPFVWTPDKMERHRELNTLLYRNIMNEGIVL